MPTLRVAALVLGAAVVGAAALLLPSRPAATPPTFVDRALGAANPDASLARRLATGATLSIDRRGIDAHVNAATFALAARDAGHGAWQRYGNGVARAASFGRETILFGINRAEQFLTVDRRQGTRTWSWQLDATNGVPHLGPDGGVTFTRAARLVGFHILPVAVLDRHGRNVTPAGLHWSLARQGSSWILGVRLDDSRLPVPYLIDPIALIAACALPAGPGGTTACTAATSTGSSSLGITKPSAAVNGDVMVAQVTVRSTGAITAPAKWNQIGTTAQDAAGPIEQAVYWHLVDGTEPGTITFTWAGGNADASGGLVTYKGVDPFVGFDQGASAFTSMNSGGTPATGNPAGLAITTTATSEMLQAAYGVANGVTITQSAGQTIVREWTASSTGGTKVTAGFADGVQAAAGASGNKTATWVTNSLWAANLFALKNEAADGTGTVAASFTTASASQTGLTQTLTYTPAAGSMANGDVSFLVPAGWTAPQATTPTGASYVTATGGSGANTIAVTGTGPWTVTVSGVTLDQGAAQTLVMKYGDTGSGGPGATAPSTTGGAAWTTKERSSSRGTLTALTSPTITVYGVDGGSGGAILLTFTTASASQSGLSQTLRWSAPAGGTSNGTLQVDVPAGWTPPTTAAGAGHTTTNLGVISCSGQRITVTGITRSQGQTVTITYGSGGTATATATSGAQTWQFDEASTVGGVITPIAVQPSVTVYAADGAGAAAPATTNVSASQAGNTVTFTYTAATGDMSAGGVKLTIPAGWTAPSVTTNNAGYTTSSMGTLTVAARVVTVANLTLTVGSTFTITYGDTGGGGPGATATATVGAQTWQVQDKATAGGVYTNIGSSPSITINAANGTGTMTVLPANVGNGSTGNALSFMYTAAAGGMAGGDVTVVAPAGWSAPSTTATDPGYATASTGAVSVAGQTITVSGVTLAGGATMTIVYGDTGGGGPGATAGTTSGANVFPTQQRSTAGGVLANIAVQPSLNVYAADGSGTATSSISVVSAGQTGRTVALTYTATTGGIGTGSLTVVVPSGWTPPSTVAGPGFTTSSVGSVAVAGQTVTVTGITRTAGQTVVVTYGTATATSTTGAQTWQVQEASTAAGVLTSIASSPAITVEAADGSGTMTASPVAVSAAQAGMTMSFTYTAAAAGMSGGTINVTVPAGWSAPSTTSSAAGYSTATLGTVTVAARTITVSNLTLAGGATATITYGDKSGSGPGATVTATTGAATWTAQERSTAAGVLTNLAASPSITVYAANGTGTMTVLPANVVNGSTGNTLTFTYTAAAGGMAAGDVTVTAPAGWSAPSTTPTEPGYATASTGAVSAAGQTLTVSGVTLAGGATMTIVYGDKGGGGPGATAGTAGGANVFQTQQRSTAAGVLASIAASPSPNVYAADGSGTMTTPTANVANGSTNTIVFTYKAAAGGISNGSVALTVPAGWPAPTAGNTTSSLGARSYAGQTVTVSSLTLAANATFTITYGPGTAPTTGGAQTWSTSEASTAGGTLTPLAASPSVNVYARDGSGTLAAAPSTVGYGSTGNTETLTYTAAAGGIGNGSVTVVVPAGWSAPSIVPGSAGYTVASTGTVAAAGQTITVSSVTLAGGATLTITYGSGLPGATAPSVAGAQTWQAQSKATAGGVLTNLGASPSTTVAQPPSAATAFPAVSALYGTGFWTAGCANPGFCGTATDNSGSGIQKVELTIRQGTGTYWDGSGFSSATPVFVAASGGSSWSYVFLASSFPADGSYTVQVRPTDNLNGVGALTSITFTVDQTPPSSFSLDAPTADQAIRNGQTVSVPSGSPTDANGIAGVAFKACAGTDTCTFAGATVTIGLSSVSPYSTSWSSQPADGPYKVVAQATDNAGNTTDSPAVAVTVDNTTPVHALTTASGSGAYLAGGTMYFKGNAAGSFVLHDALTDATSGPASVAYPDVATAGWTHPSESTSTGPGFASGTFSWTASPSLPSGYVVTGHDVAGNAAAQPVTFVDDTTAPAGGSVSYTGGYYTVASVPVTLGDGTDSQSGVDTTSAGSELLQRASATLAAGACGGFGAYTTIATHPGVAFTDTDVSSGTCYRYRYVVLDNVGNAVTYTSGATVEVDTDAPNAFSLSAPAAGFVGPSATVSATGVDTGGSGIAQIEFRYCAGASCSFASGTTIGGPVATSGLASQPWDLSALADGAQYTVVARATDAAGNRTDSAPTIVTLDSFPPATSDNAPTGLQSSPVTVTLSPGDGSGSGVASTSYRVDGGGWQSGTSVLIAAPADHSNDGAHTIDYYSVDNVGNTEAVRHATVTIDTQPPSGTPADPGSVLAGTVVLSDPSPSDPGAGVASVAFQYSPHGAGTWTTSGTQVSAPWAVLFDTTAVADGQVDLREVISDAAVPANVTTVDLPGPKLIDNTPPSSASVTAPAPGVHAGGTLTLGGSASDAGSGVGQMVFKVNGAVVGTTTGTPVSVSWDSTSTPDGPVSVTVEAKDVAGNGPTVSSARTIVVDNHPPTVTLDNPGAAVRGTAALTTATSADTTQVTFERSPAGAGTWTTIAVDNSPPFTANLDTTLLADGLYDLHATATDGANVVTSNVVTTRVDNTAPTGSVTAPTAGATVGGSSVTLKATATDGGSGVATVQFRVDGAAVGTVSSSPWTLAWDPSSTPDGAHTVDTVVTDAAGNTFTTTGVTVTVDETPPSVTLTDPGTPLASAITLHAASPDADTARVDFQVSPAGAGVWMTVATDATQPYSGSFDTTTVSDGLYDFRAVACDTVGNISTPIVVAARRIDNTPPSFVSATPADGSTVAGAGSIAVTASEALSAVTGATLDDAATAAPAISGTDATFATGPLADGPHTLAGTLVDLSGKATSFTTHFTIVSGPPLADWPYVEMNAPPGATETLDSTDGGATVTTHGTYASSIDHLVLRIDPRPAALIGGGFATSAFVYDVSCYWSLTGVQQHAFSSPLEIVLANTTGDPSVVAATFENGAWRPIPLVPSPGTLPSGWSDGAFSSPDGIRILTTHLSSFTLVHDRYPPPPPRDVNGGVAADGLTLRWAPGTDAVTPIAQVQLYVDGGWIADFDATQYETKLGSIAAGDPRTFQFTETDIAGNISAATVGLRALPPLAGRSAADAVQALVASGFAVGAVTHEDSAAPAGTVIGPAAVEVLPLGSAVDLTVSAGPGVRTAAKFAIRVLAPTLFRPAQRHTILAAIAATSNGTATIALLDVHTHRLASWRRPLRTGLNHLSLQLPPAVRTALIRRLGSYYLSWTATSLPGGDRASYRTPLRVVAPPGYRAARP